MTATIYQFPTRRGFCAQRYCGKEIRLRSPGNVPAYCDYDCALAAKRQARDDEGGD